MNTPKRAASRAGWRVLAAAPAMTGSLLLLVCLSGWIAPWGPLAVLAWLSIGVLTLTRRGEAVAARLLCRFRLPSSEETGRIAPVVDEVLRRCGLTPGSVDLYVITDGSATPTPSEDTASRSPPASSRTTGEARSPTHRSPASSATKSDTSPCDTSG